ncbi:hypothetical protein F4780DRAFT_778808 [Xylariomycetidae sp. FL0641]|nr:hypothetical protein F4780DRAFT_778808 [Xylariomycetidae sp. FL0641]
MSATKEDGGGDRVNCISPGVREKWESEAMTCRPRTTGECKGAALCLLRNAGSSVTDRVELGQ